ncbi:CPBP family intramembrane glutamic endopeptidase [Natrialbaceae archaeon A-CW1-1]
MSTVRRHLLAFVLLTFLISWTAWGVLAVLGTEPGINLGGVLWLLGGLGPPIAAAVVTRMTDGSQSTRQLLGRLLRWRVGWQWYGVAVLLPGVVVISAIIIDTQVRGVTTPIPGPEFVLLLVGMIVYSSVIAGGLEEIGWRGFALPRLQTSFDALAASVVIGVVWVVWHVPLFIVPGVWHTALPVLPFIVQGIALAVVFTWLYNSTRGSLLLVVLLHGSVNAWLSTVWILREDIDPVTLWVMALLVCLIAFGVVAVYGTEHLSHNERQMV